MTRIWQEVMPWEASFATWPAHVHLKTQLLDRRWVGGMMCRRCCDGVDTLYVVDVLKQGSDCVLGTGRGMRGMRG